MRPPEFRIRRSARPNALAIVAAVVVHLLLGLVVIHGRLPTVPHRAPSFISLAPPEPDQERASTVRFFVPRLERGEGRTSRPLPPPNPLVPDTAVPPPQPVAPVVDSAPTPRHPVPRLGPSLGDGRLWVRPLPLPPKELAKRLERTHVELVDSAVHAIVQRYLDSIAIEPGADQAKLPEWVTEVEGKKFGLDGKNIYIAGLKIPAVVLALLPLPAAGNQQMALDHNGQVIVEDLRRAAVRASNLAEFKEAIRALRAEKQRQKDFERAQRENPDSAAKGAKDE